MAEQKLNVFVILAEMLFHPCMETIVSRTSVTIVVACDLTTVLISYYTARCSL